MVLTYYFPAGKMSATSLVQSYTSEKQLLLAVCNSDAYVVVVVVVVVVDSIDSMLVSTSVELAKEEIVKKFFQITMFNELK